MNLTTKDLKKQLFAAIAMVTVSGIALGSSTYAWFVTNNRVYANLSTISAKSNAAFLNIAYDASAKESNDTAATANISNEQLYPAMWSNHVFENGVVKFVENSNTELQTSEKIYHFETATASGPNAADVQDDTTILVGTNGTPEQAVTGKYAVLNAFHVNAKATSFKDLKVAKATIAADALGNAALDNALRVLVVCGDNWVLCDKSGILLCQKGTDGTVLSLNKSGDSDKADWGYLNPTVTANSDTDVIVNMYVFYYGGDKAVYTNNLSNLQNASKSVVVDLTATAIEE